jgi:hypothetical protein
MSRRKRDLKKQVGHRVSDEVPAPPTDPGDQESGDQESQITALARSHLRFGWWLLLFFISLGVTLEALHGFKVGWYLDVSNTTRRHLWTLAHAHGTLLSMLNLVFAATLPLIPAWPTRARRLASCLLFGATVLLPVGFFLGGSFFHSGDPGLGIVLVPVGAAFLVVAVLLTALSTRR